MITRQNIKEEYPRIFQSKLPKELQNEKYDAIVEMLEFYSEDEKIAEYVDRFIEKLNEVVHKKKTQPAKETPKPPQAAPKSDTNPFAARVEKYVGSEVTYNKIIYRIVKVWDDEVDLVNEDRNVHKKIHLPTQKVWNLIQEQGVKPTNEAKQPEKPVQKPVKQPKPKKEPKPKPVKAAKAKPVKTAKAKPVKAAKAKPVKVAKAKPVKAAKAKPEKTTKVKPEKAAPKPKVSKKDNVTPVTELPLEVQFIKSYCGWDGKVKTKTQVYTFIKRLQRAIAEKKIRKTSEYASQIEYIQNRLIAFYNEMRSGTKTYEIPAAKLSELKGKSNMRWADHVQVIKQYINILNDTQTGTKEKAKALLQKIEGSRFTVTKEIADIQKSLKDYLDGKTEAPEINEMALQGLYGLAGLKGLGNLPEPKNQILQATAFKNASFNLLGFTGKWLQLVGDPSEPFKMMIWGTGGSGKSTIAIDFAHYLASKLNKRVLFVSNEEGAGATFHEKMTRLNAFHPNLFITKTLPSRLIEYDFVFCDSANSMQLELPAFLALAKQYPRLSWVLMFQTTKDGNFLGTKDWQHAVDVEIYCNEGKAVALKSRFGGSEKVEIF